MGWFFALAAVVFTVSVAVCALVPLIVTDCVTVHVAGSLAAAGVMAQLRLTVPANPYHGVTETGDVLPLVAPGARESGAPVRTEKYGAGVVVNEKTLPLVVPTLFCATAW
jgi:hypothetical protein